MYKNILVPTDGSASARAAVDHAVTLAGICGAEVHGLFVTDSGTAEKVGGRYPQSGDELADVGSEAVGELEERAAEEGVETTVSVVGGTVHEEIVRYADENDADIIVMGTRGRQGVERYLLGSVTERVVRTAEQAVLTVDEATPAHPAD